MSSPYESSESCRLCGLTVHGRKDGFCCIGCFHVFEILKQMLNTSDPQAMRDHPFLRQMQSQGIVPSKEGDPARMEANRESPEEASESEQVEQRVMKVTGMWCPSCSWVIERTLCRREGVVNASASFSSDRVKVTSLPRVVGPTGKPRPSGRGASLSPR